MDVCFFFLICVLSCFPSHVFREALCIFVTSDNRERLRVEEAVWALKFQVTVQVKTLISKLHAAAWCWSCSCQQPAPLGDKTSRTQGLLLPSHSPVLCKIWAGAHTADVCPQPIKQPSLVWVVISAGIYTTLETYLSLEKWKEANTRSFLPVFQASAAWDWRCHLRCRCWEKEKHREGIRDFTFHKALTLDLVFSLLKPVEGVAAAELI